MEDFEILQELIDHGPEFLKNIEDLSLRTKYEKMYLDESDIFGDDNIEKYINCLLNNNSVKLWVNLAEYLDSCEKTVYLKKIISKNNSIQVLHKLMEVKSVQELLADYGLSHMLWDLLLHKLLNTITCDQINWSSKVRDIQILIKKIITNKNDSRNYFVEWCSNILNKCINKMNIDINNYDPSLNSDYFLTNMLGIFLNFWREGITPSRLDTLDYNYIISEKCPIKWMDKKVGINNNYTFLNQLIFLIYDTIRVGYIPTLFRTKNWPKLLNEITEQINTFNGGNYNSIALGYLVPQLNNQKKIINNHIEAGKIIIENNTLNTWLMEFYEITIPWLKKQKTIDDILADFVKLLLHMSNNNSSNSDVLVFAINIIKTKDYTSNIDTRLEFTKYVAKTLYKLNDYQDLVLTSYSSALLVIHNDLHSAHIRSDYKFFGKLKIYSFIDQFYLGSNLHFINSMIDDLNASKKFVNTILMDISEYNDSFDEFYEKIKNSENEDEKNKNIETIKHIIQYNIQMLEFIDRLVNKMLEKPQLISMIKSPEISSTLSTILDFNIVNLTTKIENNQYITIDEKDTLMRLIGGIFTTLIIIEYDFDDIINNYNFDIKYYEKFNKYSPYNISKLIEILRKSVLDKDGEDDSYEECPDEFLDPITYSLIDEPCLLPGMVGFSEETIYFDKSTILRQLLIKDENPYNRQPLTIETFEEFNKKSDIKQKLLDFKKKLILWKSSNKKRKI